MPLDALLLFADEPADFKEIGPGGIALLVVVWGIVLAAVCVLFEKAGKPGWLAIIPIVNIVTMLDVVEKPRSRIYWFLIPIAIPFVLIEIAWALTGRFGKTGFVRFCYTVGLCFMSFIFLPLLVFAEGHRFRRSTPDKVVDFVPQVGGASYYGRTIPGPREQPNP